MKGSCNHAFQTSHLLNAKDYLTSLVILILGVKECRSEFNPLSHASKREELKVYIQYTMLLFKNNKNATETAKKFYSIYD